MTTLLTWTTDQPPALRRPVLIVAMEGFVDAGAVAATAGAFLRHRWRSDLLGRFDRDALLDYRARRPTAIVDSGRLRRLEWPDLELFGAQLDGPRDALLLLGPEPDMRWEAFGQSVVELCATAGVDAVLTLGAYPAAAPHTRPVRIMKAVNAIAGDIVPSAGDITGYTGPVGASTALQQFLGDAGVAAVGLWAEVPHYIAGSPNPSGALALVNITAESLHVEVDTAELQAAATLHQQQVLEAIAEHPEAAEMVGALELLYDEGGSGEDLPTGEDIAEEIQRFLRSQG